MLGLTFYSKLDWGSYIISIAKTASKKIGAVICSMKFLCISINLPYGHTWNTVVMPGLVLLVATCNCWISYKNICRTFAPSLDASLEPQAHHQNVASLSLLQRYYFGKCSIELNCSSELALLVLLPYARGRCTCYSNRLHDFSVTVPRCYKDAYVNSFFPHIARLWNSLHKECFPLTYDLNGFKSRINRHLLTVGSF